MTDLVSSTKNEMLNEIYPSVRDLFIKDGKLSKFGETIVFLMTVALTCQFISRLYTLRYGKT